MQARESEVAVFCVQSIARMPLRRRAGEKSWEGTAALLSDTPIYKGDYGEPQLNRFIACCDHVYFQTVNEGMAECAQPSNTVDPNRNRQGSAMAHVPHRETH